MSMTAYMALLAANQPWNLILFMVVPVALAETLVALEFFLLHRLARKDSQAACSALPKVTRTLGFVLMAYYACLVIYLVAAVIPGIEWQGPIDVLAITFFLLAFIPTVFVALTGRNLDLDVVKKHFISLILYLVIAHLAMVFGMLDPGLTGDARPMQMEGMEMGSMPAHHDHAHMQMDMGSGSAEAPAAHDHSQMKMDMGSGAAAAPASSAMEHDHSRM